MTENKIKTYITRDKKRNAVIAFCVVFFVFVIISILELVPGNITDPTQDDDMGPDSSHGAATDEAPRPSLRHAYW